MKLPVLDLIVFIVLTFGNVIFVASFFFKTKPLLSLLPEAENYLRGLSECRYLPHLLVA